MLSYVQLFVTLQIVANLPGSSVNGIFPARVLEWAVISSSRGSFQPRDQTHISCVSLHWTGEFFITERPGKPILHEKKSSINMAIAGQQWLDIASGDLPQK